MTDKKLVSRPVRIYLTTYPRDKYDQVHMNREAIVT
jgi:hypothetical protein